MRKIKNLFKYFLKQLSPRLFHWLRRYYYIKYILPKQFMTQVNTLSKDDLVIDIGANIGQVSECLALRNLKVISFEPNREAFAALKKVSNLYHNIKIYNLAAGTQNRNTKLYLHNKTKSSKIDLSQASSMLSDKPNVSSELFEEIKEIDFAEFLKSIKTPISLIKIDIEGFEIKLINYLLDEKALDNVKQIYLETHEKKFKKLLQGTDMLKKRIIEEGYQDKFFFDWH